MFLFDFYFNIYSCADREQTLTAWMALMLEYYDDPCRLIDHMAMMDRHMHRHVKVKHECIQKAVFTSEYRTAQLRGLEMR